MTKAPVCVNTFLLKWTLFFQHCHQQAGPGCLKSGVLCEPGTGRENCYGPCRGDGMTEPSALNRDQLQAVVGSQPLRLGGRSECSLSVGGSITSFLSGPRHQEGEGKAWVEKGWDQSWRCAV